MANILLFNKPFRVLSQFSDDAGRATLAHYLRAPGFRPAGRLDFDSEGLLVLCDDGRLQQRIANPRHRHWKSYWVQVEGRIPEAALARLRGGVALKDGPTLPARARAILEPPGLWPREPPVRERQHIADSWLELSLQEGRNRQVRRMTAAVGYPTLRLVRHRVGDWSLAGLAPGESRQLAVHLPDGTGARTRPSAGAPQRRIRKPGAGKP
ncbi:pseudouridine synthase [Chromatocurvus halotolerans]|uniref:23S rRNA pseudouridine2457 synthase n=1 Tax=Chromatocurvus halotolerans TaxID=1132028 RepID=A0A4R2KWJ4_9GAMM|nr:pseudouridine synthase [Chromatocurvus halotolerans]TCO78263.1 23S rRNA pseudouridine2457 synthase [Chromatocurvus halotolerans]